MKYNFLLFVLLTMIFVGCKQKNNTPDSHVHTTESDDQVHNHEIAFEKVQYIVYDAYFELFAEADPFVIGQESKVLIHITNLIDFTPLTQGSIEMSLVVFGKKVSQKLHKPSKDGMYLFSVIPENIGEGKLQFNIETENGDCQIIVSGVRIFADQHDAMHKSNTEELPNINSTVFTKEQSWKIDFATEEVKVEPIGQVIKTTAQIHSVPNDEVLVTSSTVGVVVLSDYDILEGKEVKKGQLLFTISGNNLIVDNSQIRYTEAQNNYELALSHYERAKELAKDKIVSDKDLQVSKNQFENAKVLYDNLKRNFNSSGQSVTSPVNGFVKELLVENGQFVEVGQPIVSISMNSSLFLHADVQQKYHAILDNIVSATFKTPYDNKVYTLDQLHGRIISYGRTTNNHNFLIPINLEIDYIEGFMPGSFVELYLKSITDEMAITIPNSALLEDHGNFFVFIQINPELFELREVTIGVTDGLRTEIIKGLTQDDRVVSKGAVHIKLARGTGELDAHSGHVH